MSVVSHSLQASCLILNCRSANCVADYYGSRSLWPFRKPDIIFISIMAKALKLSEVMVLKTNNQFSFHSQLSVKLDEDFLFKIVCVFIFKNG